MSSTKSILVIAGASLASFLLASVGAYFVVPAVAPGVADSLSTPSTRAMEADSTMMSESSRGVSTADSLEGPSTQRPDSMPGRNGRVDSSGAGPDVRVVQARLRDSIETLHERLDQRRKNEKTLIEEKEALEAKLAAIETDQAKVTELSSALLDMRQRELAALLKNVEMSVLERLYTQASGSARTRLLRAMPPGRAASFVNKVVEAGSTQTSGTGNAGSEPLSSSN